MKAQRVGLIALMAVWFVLAVAQVWKVQYDTAEAQYYHALVAYHAAQEAEIAWTLIAERQRRDTTLTEADRAYPDQQRDALADIAVDLEGEILRLEARLDGLSLGRFTPEDR